MNGYISYPRTDNTVYPKSLDLNAILETLRGGCLTLMSPGCRKTGVRPDESKKESTDHPPIQPHGCGDP